MHCSQAIPDVQWCKAADTMIMAKSQNLNSFCIAEFHLQYVVAMIKSMLISEVSLITVIYKT